MDEVAAKAMRKLRSLLLSHIDASHQRRQVPTDLHDVYRLIVTLPLADAEELMEVVVQRGKGT